MKKTIAALLLGLVSFSAFAETLTFEEFSNKLIMHYDGIDYVSQEVYERWNGDADAFIEYYEKNGVDYYSQEEQNDR